MDSEVWVDIEGYKGYYQISSFGNVRSLDRYVACKGGSWKFMPSQIITQRLNKGYPVTNLNRDGLRKTALVSRLVAMHFVPNNHNKPEVNHIDEDKTNNHASNLEWVTAKENSNHGTRNARIGAYTKDHPVANRKCGINGVGAVCKPILQIDIATNEIVGEYPSVKDALKFFGCKPNTGQLSACLTGNGAARTFKGYWWKYKQKE